MSRAPSWKPGKIKWNGQRSCPGKASTTRASKSLDSLALSQDVVSDDLALNKDGEVRHRARPAGAARK